MGDQSALTEGVRAMASGRVRRAVMVAVLLALSAGGLTLGTMSAAATPALIALSCPGAWGGDCGPSGVAFAPDGATAYVANQNADRVSVINVATAVQTTTIALPLISGQAHVGPYGIVVNSAGTRVYVADNYGNQLSVIDATTNTVIDTVVLTASPSEVLLSADGSILYVTETDGAVHLFDTATDTPNATTPTIAIGPNPFGLALSPDGSTLLVGYAGGVRIVNAATNTAGATVAVSPGPAFLAFTPDGSHAYVANQAVGTVSDIDVAAGTATTPLTIPDPVGIAITPDGTGYVSDLNDNRIYTFDAATNQLVGAFIPGGSHPHAIAISPDGSLVYIVNQGGDDTVTVLDATAQPHITSATPPSPQVGMPYSFTFTARARPAATFTITAGALPAGLVLNSSTGVVSGTPTTAGASTFTVTASNGIGTDDTAAYTLITAATLAATGIDMAPAAAGGMGVLLLGALLLAARRRTPLPRR